MATISDRIGYLFPAPCCGRSAMLRLSETTSGRQRRTIRCEFCNRRFSVEFSAVSGHIVGQIVRRLRWSHRTRKR